MQNDFQNSAREDGCASKAASGRQQKLVRLTRRSEIRATEKVTVTLFTFPTLKLFVRLTLCVGGKCHFEQRKYQLLLPPRRLIDTRPGQNVARPAAQGDVWRENVQLCVHLSLCCLLCLPVLKGKCELLTAPRSAKS